jgi:TusA-related sulfurtransferase
VGLTTAPKGQPMDLRGVPCPLNYVRTKLKLERLEPGSQLEVWLDPGEPVERVPDSLKLAGHLILALDPQPEGHVLLRVERGSVDEDRRL